MVVTNPAVAAKLCQECTKYKHDRAAPLKDDMVFENVVLFNCNALLLCAFTNTIKDGDSDLIIILLKVYALAYCRMHQPKYVLEGMIQIHNLNIYGQSHLGESIIMVSLLIDR